MAIDFLQEVAAGERWPAGQQEEERAAQAVEVGADVGAVRVVGLLRRHVVGRAHQVAFERQALAGAKAVREPGQTEVEDLDEAPDGGAGGRLPRPHRRQGDEQVRGFDVAVHQAALVGVLQPARRLADIVAGLRDGQRPALLDQPGQIDTFVILHGQNMRITRPARRRRRE